VRALLGPVSAGVLDVDAIPVGRVLTTPARGTRADAG